MTSSKDKSSDNQPEEFLEVESGLLQITDLQNGVYSPSVNGTDERIAFIASEDGIKDIWILQFDGSTTKVTNDSAEEKTPSWSYFSNKIVYSKIEDNSENINIVSLDNSTVTSLPEKPYSRSMPWLSPQDDRITLTSNINGYLDIFIYTISTEEEIHIETGGTENFRSVWSPDGEKIAFVSNRNGSRDIYLYLLQTSEVIRLTSSPADEDMPSWSWDSNFLAFASNWKGNWDIWTLEINNRSNVKQITFNSANDSSPCWYPDDQSILFASYRDGLTNLWKVSIE
ncbi:TolB family protein [candidate division KSB1 bacterium]